MLIDSTELASQVRRQFERSIVAGAQLPRRARGTASSSGTTAAEGKDRRSTARARRKLLAPGGRQPAAVAADRFAALSAVTATLAQQVRPCRTIEPRLLRQQRRARPAPAATRTSGDAPQLQVAISGAVFRRGCCSSRSTRCSCCGGATRRASGPACCRSSRSAAGSARPTRASSRCTSSAALRRRSGTSACAMRRPPPSLHKAVGQQVRLHYTEHPGLPTNCFGETDYFVERFEIVGPPLGSSRGWPAPRQ